MIDEVRLARPYDRERIMELCALLHDENGLFPMERSDVYDVIDRATHDQGLMIGIVGEPGEPAKAAICLHIEKVWYANQWYLGELFAFVHPEHRKSDLAKRLLGFAKKTADQLGIPLMTGIITNHRVEAKVRLYERMLPKVGAFFCYRPEATKG